ncbi:MAG: lipoprotein-releasing ABC transporter permease subunit [Hyphomicrobiaceae bacterium]
MRASDRAATPDRETIDTPPFAPFEWMLATRYLRARRKEGFISVIAGFSFIGITLGVATLIIVMAVMNGFRAQLFDKILGLNGHVAAFIVTPNGGAFEDYETFARRITTVPGVTSATPLIEGQVMVSSPAQALGGLVRGITEQGLRNSPLVSRNIIAGSIEGFDGQSGIAIGTRLSEALRLGLGDYVTLISPRGNSTPFGNAPRSRSYQIAALFEMGMNEYDKTMLFMPMGEAQKFFSKPDRADVIEVKVSDPQSVETQIAAMQRLDVGAPTVFQSWKQRNQTFFTVLEVERTVMFIILSLIILVAALNIISGMMMLVKDKGRDIAILRTMGATRGAMMRVFLITGASIGVVGTLAGFMLGVVFCWNIESIRQGVQWLSGTTLMDPSVYYLTRLPAEIDPWETLFIVIMALVLSVAATIYPSWRASTLDPVEALRYE